MRVVVFVPQPEGFENEPVIMEWIGAAYVAAAAAQAGHDTHLIDQAMPGCETEDRLVEALVRLDPQVLGLSASTCAWPLGLRVVRRVRQRTGCFVVAGGVHPTNSFADVMQDPAIDVVVRGEGERTFVSLLAAREAGTALDTIPGLVCRDAQGRPVATPDAPRIADLDALPWPVRLPRPDGYRFRGLIAGRRPISRVAVVSGSRDCPHRCVFCTPQYTGTRRWISRSVAGILDEVEHLVRDRATQFIFFSDPSFGHSPARVRELCEGIRQRRLEFLWGCELRVTDITPPVARGLADAGCVFVGVGIDTGTEESLKRLKKGMGKREIVAGTRALFDADIEVHGNLIVGFPWDDRRTIEESLDFYRGLPLDVFGMNFAVPFEGSGLAAMAVEEDLIIDRDLSHWNARTPIMRTRHLDGEELEGLYRWMTRAYYVRPGYVAHVAQRVVQRPARLLEYGSLAADFLYTLRKGGSRIRG